jgi:hypothetical protein
MKATELRIGNLVWEDYGGEYEVLMISPNYVDLVKPFLSLSGRYDINSLKPIPLTEEWLLKLGFVWVEDIKILKGYLDDYIDGNSNTQLKYVHQLQNLYFALTGEELTLN